MTLTYRVWEPESGAVVRGLRNEGFLADLAPDVVLGRDRVAVVVHDVADLAEAEAADSVVEVVDRSAVRVLTR